MAVAEQQLSPEEKLLKVIQGGGEVQKDPSPEEKMLGAVKQSPQPASPLRQAQGLAAPRRAEDRDQKSEVRDPAFANPLRQGSGGQEASAGKQESGITGQRVDAKAQPTQTAAAGKPAGKVVAAASPPAAKAATPVAAAGPQPASPLRQAQGFAEPRKKAAQTKPPESARKPAKKEETKAAESEEKPKLKVLKPEPEPEAKEPPAKTLIGAPDTGVIGAGTPAVVSGRKRADKRLTIGMINRGLAVAAVLILVLTGLEVRETVRTSEVRGQKSEVSGPASAPGPEQENAAEMLPLASFADPWKSKDLFAYAGGETGKASDTNKQAAPPPPELAGRLKLMGFSKAPESDGKAILKDTKDERILIAGRGEKILVGEQPLELLQIQKDYVVLSDGKESITIR